VPGVRAAFHGYKWEGNMPGKRQTTQTTENDVAPENETPKRKRGPRAGTENARRGGMAVREKYGQDFFAQIGSKGGKTVRERRGPDFYANIGRMGGQTTRDTLGVSHYERIGRMGGLRARRREREATEGDNS
jgi:general stress protein YciG